jgi:hypothetical protein
MFTVTRARLGVAVADASTLLEGLLDTEAVAVGGGVDVRAPGFLPPELVAATAMTATTPRTTRAPPTARATER